MTTPAPPPRRRPHLRLAALRLGLLLVAPVPAAAVPANRSLALEVAGPPRSGAGAPAVALAAGCWLEWELEVLARLGLGSAPATSGRGAAGAAWTEAGLRWRADEGRWRPALELGAGVRLPGARRATAATALLQGALERQLAPGWALTAAAGLRWVAGEGAAGQAALGVRRYF